MGDGLVGRVKTDDEPEWMGAWSSLCCDFGQVDALLEQLDNHSRATNSLVMPQSTPASTIETPNATGRTAAAPLDEAPVAAPGEDEAGPLDDAGMTPPVALTTCVESEPE